MIDQEIRHDPAEPTGGTLVVADGVPAVVKASESLLGEVVGNAPIAGHRLTQRYEAGKVLSEARLEARLGHHHISLHVAAPRKVPSAPEQQPDRFRTSGGDADEVVIGVVETARSVVGGDHDVLEAHAPLARHVDARFDAAGVADFER